MRRGVQVLALLQVAVLLACASIKHYQTIEQPLGPELQTYVGGTILKLDLSESLPNAFGRADIYGGRRPTGSIELKYLGLVSDGGAMKLRVLSTDVRTTEDWRRRLGNKGTVTSSADAVDFEQNLNQPFEIEGVTVHFLTAESARLSYRLTRQLASRR